MAKQSDFSLEQSFILDEHMPPIFKMSIPQDALLDIENILRFLHRNPAVDSTVFEKFRHELLTTVANRNIEPASWPEFLTNVLNTFEFDPDGVRAYILRNREWHTKGPAWKFKTEEFKSLLQNTSESAGLEARRLINKISDVLANKEANKMDDPNNDQQQRKYNESDDSKKQTSDRVVGSRVNAMEANAEAVQRGASAKVVGAELNAINANAEAVSTSATASITGAQEDILTASAQLSLHTRIIGLL